MAKSYRLDQTLYLIYKDDDYQDILYKISIKKELINQIIQRHSNDKKTRDCLIKYSEKDIIYLYKLKELYDNESVSILYNFLPNELILYIKKFL